jgi:hypothetical protein
MSLILHGGIYMMNWLMNDHDGSAHWGSFATAHDDGLVNFSAHRGLFAIAHDDILIIVT